MKLKVYGDRMSQPTRAVLIFCKVNGIDYDEITVDLTKHQNSSPEFKEINPMGQVPAVVHGKFKLFESHAILIYLASSFPAVADHWYPTDTFKRARIHSVLDWHHSNLRRGAVTYVMKKALAPMIGRSLNPGVAARAQKLMLSSLSKIENIWLKDDGSKFLLGQSQPSIADLSLVCEIMELEVLGREERNSILSPYKKVQQWIENTRNATSPYFDEVHKVVYTFRGATPVNSTTEIDSGKNTLIFNSKM